MSPTRSRCPRPASLLDVDSSGGQALPQPSHEVLVRGRPDDLVELGAIVADETDPFHHDVVGVPPLAASVEPCLDGYLDVLGQQDLGPHDGKGSVHHLARVGEPGVLVGPESREIRALEQLGEKLREFPSLGRRAWRPVAPQGTAGGLLGIEELPGNRAQARIALGRAQPRIAENIEGAIGVTTHEGGHRVCPHFVEGKHAHGEGQHAQNPPWCYPGPTVPTRRCELTTSIGELRLLEACAQPGCPICFCLTKHSREQLTALLYEQVTDLETRRRLRASWGLCNWHTWMLHELPGARVGTAIVSEDLLRRLIEQVGRAAPTTGGRRFARWLMRARARGAQRLATLYRRRPRCPVCERAGEAEQRYLQAMLTRVDHPEFRRAYAGSDGLCAPHVLRAVELVRGRGELIHLLQLTLVKWARARGELAAFIAKHDHRNARPFTDAETASCRRVLELLSGAPAIFGNDLPYRGH